MRYCIKCGRQESDDNPIISGYCIDCYLKYRGVFKETPFFKIVICSRCGRWKYSGKWFEADSLESIVSRSFENQYKRFIREDIGFVEVYRVNGIRKVTRDHHEALFDLRIVFKNGVEADVRTIIRFKIEKTICPYCLRRAGKSFNALVQIRSERGFLTEDEIDYVYDIVSEKNLVDSVVEITENKNGVDIKVLDPIIAKRIASIISREKGAKVIETFKLRKYDPSRGIKQGITTISVRLPNLSKGDIVLYKGEPGVVEKYNGSRLVIKRIDGSLIKLSIEDYWRGEVIKPKDLVYGNEYTVVGYDNSSIYLVNEDTGEFVEYPRTGSLYNLKQGDKMRGFRIGNRFYVIKSDEVGR